MFGVTRFIQVRDGIRSSELRRQSKIRDAVAWANLSKIRWGGQVMRLCDNCWMRAVSAWTSEEHQRAGHSPTTARDRDESRRYWRPLEQIDDQQGDR
ncbi:hypothetical protein Q1695_004496 [Nippostrongylus brasiliensis]|nr:hypothetical protein Q1695_004496 [Nippostrongylus brasiliensis]